MFPLLFIILLITSSILVALRVTDEVTWFTYYTGGMVGLLISSLALEWSNKRRKKKEEDLEKKRRPGAPKTADFP